MTDNRESYPPPATVPPPSEQIEPWYCADCGGLQIRPSDSDTCDVCLVRRDLYRGRPFALWREQRFTRKIVRETQEAIASELATRIALLWPQAQLFLSVQRQYSTYVPADWAHLTQWPWVVGMTIGTAERLAESIAACGAAPPAGEAAFRLEAEVDLEHQLAEAQDPADARLLSEAGSELQL